MTGEVIFVDSSVFLAFFVDGVDIFGKLRGLLVTSTNVIEEVTYVLIKERAKDVTGIGKHYDLLTYLREHPDTVKQIASEVISDVSSLLNALKIVVLAPVSYSEMFDVVKNYGLLPNDALIVATCRYYGIKKIATFDEDFKRVDFLEVVELEDS